jgi:hypothetical protein
MIASFAVLRDRIVRAMQGDASPGAPPDISFPPESQLDPAQQMQQMPQLQVQQMAPVGRQLSPVAPNLALQAAPNLLLPGPEFRRDDLQPILDALAAIELQTRQSAENAPASLAETAAALRQTVADVAAARETVEAIEITSDASVDAALGTDWWRTVEGKGAFADAVADSINERMRSIAETAESPSVAIRKSVALQEELRNTLRSRQEELESQFAEQRKQLASLSGAAGVVPIDLASFIGLFPLVVGLVLGFMLVRVGETRRQGALAATDLANAAADDADTRRWLTRRVLGGGNAITPMLATVAVAIGMLAWIGLAVLQVKDAAIDAPLTPRISGAIAALLVSVRPCGTALRSGASAGGCGDERVCDRNRHPVHLNLAYFH